MAWESLCDRVAHIELTHDVDSFCKSLHTSSQLLVQPMYVSLVYMACQFRKDIICKLKIVQKIVCIICLQGFYFNKGHLAKYKWKGSKMCVASAAASNLSHLFIHALFLTSATFFFWGGGFSLSPPSSISNMCGMWFKRFTKSLRSQILVGALVLYVRPYGTAAMI